MTWKLEKATIAVPNLAALAVAVIIGTTGWVSLGKDQENTEQRVEKVEAAIPDIAKLRTGQAVMAERMTTLEESVKELKQDQKTGLQRILDKLDKK